ESFFAGRDGETSPELEYRALLQLHPPLFPCLRRRQRGRNRLATGRNDGHRAQDQGEGCCPKRKMSTNAGVLRCRRKPDRHGASAARKRCIVALSGSESGSRASAAVQTLRASCVAPLFQSTSPQ